VAHLRDNVAAANLVLPADATGVRPHALDHDAARLWEVSLDMLGL
jgi:hypothetical protein